MVCRNYFVASMMFERLFCVCFCVYFSMTFVLPGQSSPSQHFCYVSSHLKQIAHVGTQDYWEGSRVHVFWREISG